MMGQSLEEGQTAGTAPYGGIGQAPQPAIGGLRNPNVAFFHVAFKVAAILVYMFSSIFSSSFVHVFIADVLLLTFDFWTVKNITGRIMVGLRWWCEIGDDGTNIWKFESHEDKRTINSVDSGVFWVALFASPLVWILFAVGCVFRLSFDWLLIVLVALTLSAANIIGYVKCKKDARSKLQGFATKTGMNALMSISGFGS